MHKRVRIAAIILFIGLIVGIAAYLVPNTGAAKASQEVSLAEFAKEPALRIAAATDLRFALEDLKKMALEKNPKSSIEVIYGASGQIVQKIEAGAPYDLFLSADRGFAEKVETLGLSVDKPFRYGTGRLVLWTRNDSKLHLEPVSEKFLNGVAVTKIAIANPTTAPYGNLAKHALESARLFEKFKAKIVIAEGVSQAAQFVSSGATSVGFISESLALSSEMSHLGEFIRVGEDLAPPLEATGVIIRKSENQAAAREFRDLIVSPEGQAVLSRYGLGIKE